MTVKEARKIISEACFSVKRDSDDYLFWGYSRQGVPSSFLHIRVGKERITDVAEACQHVKGEDFPSAFAKQRAIRKALQLRTVIR